MKLAFTYWLRRISKDRATRLQARHDTRRDLRHQWQDWSKRGKGNRAWKRAEQLSREPGTLIWPDYAL